MKAIQEFGAANPRVIYVALRWNAPTINKDHQRSMPDKIASLLGRLPRDRVIVKANDIRIYNLVGPEGGRGMDFEVKELREALRTLRSIVRCAKKSGRLKQIIVGGTSGIMPGVALALKLALPKVCVELRYHHAARAVNATKLELVQAL